MVEGKWTRLRITISNRPGSQATTVLVQPHLGTFVTQSWHTSMACHAGWELCSWHAVITTLTPLYYNHLCWPLIVPVNFSRARTLCSHFSCFKWSHGKIDFLNAHVEIPVNITTLDTEKVHQIGYHHTQTPPLTLVPTDLFPAPCFCLFKNVI